MAAEVASNNEHAQSAHAQSDLEVYANRMFNVAGVMMRDGAEDRNFISHKYDKRGPGFTCSGRSGTEQSWFCLTCSCRGS